MTTELTLPPAPSSVSAARRFVADALVELGAEGACDDAATLVSELATNAVLHARTPFTIAVSRIDGEVRISVRDHSLAQPRVRDYGTGATTGRGMRLIEAMATDWGVEPEDDGKSVWFAIPQQGAPVEVSPWDEDVDLDDVLAALGTDDDLGDAKDSGGARALYRDSWWELPLLEVAA